MRRLVSRRRSSIVVTGHGVGHEGDWKTEGGRVGVGPDLGRSGDDVHIDLRNALERRPQVDDRMQQSIRVPQIVVDQRERPTEYDPKPASPMSSHQLAQGAFGLVDQRRETEARDDAIPASG